MSYLLGGQPSENERLQLQSWVWEPAGRRLLGEVNPLAPDGPRSAVDVGCGALGWLRLLSQWCGPDGRVVGTDVDQQMLRLAGDLVAAEPLTNVTLVEDDLFASGLPAAGFDVVHARFQMAPLGRAVEQPAAYTRLARPGGLLLLEDPDSRSWSYTPDAPHTSRLILLIRDAFGAGGGNFDAGWNTSALLLGAGLDPHTRTEVVELPAGHPYLRLPVQFAASLRPRLLQTVGETELDELVAASNAELDDPTRSGVTFTLVQTWATVPD